MAGRIRLRGNALAWKRCSPGSDVAVHGPSNIGITDRIPCSKVALAQLVSHGVRSPPPGERIWMGLSRPSDSAARTELTGVRDRAGPEMLTRV